MKLYVSAIGKLVNRVAPSVLSDALRPCVDRVVNQCIGFPAGKHDDAVDVCALIGLALDQTNPGYVPNPRTRHLPDRWDLAIDLAEIECFNWKTA